MSNAIITYSPIDQLPSSQGHQLHNLLLDTTTGKIIHASSCEFHRENTSTPLGFQCPRCGTFLKISNGEITHDRPLLACRNCQWSSSKLGYKNISDAREGERNQELGREFRKVVKRLENVGDARKRERGGNGVREWRGAWKGKESEDEKNDMKGEKKSIEEFVRGMQEKERKFRGLHVDEKESWNGIEVDKELYQGICWKDVVKWEKRVDPYQWNILKQPPKMNTHAQKLQLLSPETKQVLYTFADRERIEKSDISASQVFPAINARLEGGVLFFDIHNCTKYKQCIRISAEDSEWANCNIAETIDSDVEPSEKCAARSVMVMKVPIEELNPMEDDYRLTVRVTIAFSDAPDLHEIYSEKWTLRLHLVVPIE